jgi:hypothetical protein
MEPVGRVRAASGQVQDPVSDHQGAPASRPMTTISASFRDGYPPG